MFTKEEWRVLELTQQMQVIEFKISQLCQERIQAQEEVERLEPGTCFDYEREEVPCQE